MQNKKLVYRLIISHLLALLVFKVGVSFTAIIFFKVFWIIRSLGLTVAYHRYFAHRSFKVNRFTQFILALWGGLCAQRGPLWWAAKHRTHHAHSDAPGDPHSPVQDGFWHAHMGWVLKKNSMDTDFSKVKDFAKYPELVFFNKYHDIYMLMFAGFLYACGHYLNVYFPHLNTSGAQILVWIYFLNTLAHVHATFLVNSLGHLQGRQPFIKYKVEKDDESRNIWWLALLTSGEGWHHNHHTFPYSAKVGIRPWELDLGFQVIRLLSILGLASDVKMPNLDRIQNDEDDDANLVMEPSL